MGSPTDSRLAISAPRDRTHADDPAAIAASTAVVLVQGLEPETVHRVAIHRFGEAGGVDSCVLAEHVARTDRFGVLRAAWTLVLGEARGEHERRTPAPYDLVGRGVTVTRVDARAHRGLTPDALLVVACGVWGWAPPRAGIEDDAEDGGEPENARPVRANAGALRRRTP